MKVLITGANGYLGQGIVKTLLDNNIEVIATDIWTTNVDTRAIRVDCDLFNIEKPFSYFEHPDIILHLAWRDGFIHNSTNHIDNLPFHCRFIRMLIGEGAQHISVMGSMHEIGFHEGSIDETTTCAPMSCYGIAKNALREYIKWLRTTKAFIYQWLRGYYIVGNSEYGSSVFSKITAAEMAGKTQFPFTTGTNQFDFIDYSDFCYQVAAAITQEKIDGIINICSGKPEKLCDRVERFIAENGYKIKLQYGVYPERTNESKAVWGNNSRIVKIMNDTLLRRR